MMMKNERGFSLVEVLIAAAVMAFLVLSVMGLFILGAKDVKSGKGMTEAVAAGDHIMSHLSAVSKNRIYVFAGADKDDTGTQSWTYSTVTNANDPFYDGSAQAYPDGYSDMSPGDQDMVASMKDIISSLNRAGFTLSVTPENALPSSPIGGPTDPTMGDAPVLRIALEIKWPDRISTGAATIKKGSRIVKVRFETLR